MLTGLQELIAQTEEILERWKHPDPYRPPTAPGGSKYERNLPVHTTERELTYHHSFPTPADSIKHHHQCICRKYTRRAG